MKRILVIGSIIALVSLTGCTEMNRFHGQWNERTGNTNALFGPIHASFYNDLGTEKCTWSTGGVGAVAKCNIEYNQLTMNFVEAGVLVFNYEFRNDGQELVLTMGEVPLVFYRTTEPGFLDSWIIKLKNMWKDM